MTLRREQSHTGPYITVCLHHEGSLLHKWKTCHKFTQSFYVCIYLRSHMQCWVYPNILPETYKTGNTQLYWMMDNWNIKLWYEEAGCYLSTVCMDSLNGMCVHCLWGSETFVVDIFEGNLHSRKIDPLFFVLIPLQFFQGRTLLSQGLLLKEFIYWFI